MTVACDKLVDWVFLSLFNGLLELVWLECRGTYNWCGFLSAGLFGAIS